MCNSFALSSQRYENNYYSGNQPIKQSKGRFKKGIAHYHKHETFQKLQKEQQRAQQATPIFFKGSKVNRSKRTEFTHTDASSLSLFRMPTEQILLPARNEPPSLDFLRIAAITIIFFSTFFSVSAQAADQSFIGGKRVGCQTHKVNSLSIPLLSSPVKNYSANETKTICNLVDQANKEINAFVKEQAYSVIDIAALANVTEAIIDKTFDDAYEASGKKMHEKIISSLKPWFNYTIEGPCYNFYVKEEGETSFGNRIAKTSLDTLYEQFDVIFHEIDSILYEAPSPEIVKEVKESVNTHIKTVFEDNKIQYLNDWCHYYKPTASPEDKSTAFVFAILGGSFLGVSTLVCAVFAGIFGYNKWRHKQIQSDSGYHEI